MTVPPDFETLLRHARVGDANAQYELAKTLTRGGRRDEAEHWLQAAAQSGHINALYTIATRNLFASETTVQGVAALNAAADRGSIAARRLLCVCRALGVDGPADEASALSDWIALAREDDPDALSAIACVLALSDVEDPLISDIAAKAAVDEPVAAAFLLARGGAGRSVSGDLGRYSTLLSQSRYPRTAQLTAGVKGARKDAPQPVDWDRVAERLSLTPASPPRAERLCESPDVVIFRQAVAPEICEYVIAHAAARLGPSLVYDPTRTRMIKDPLRTSMTASLSVADQDLAVIALNRLLADAAGVAEENGEFLSVMRYAPGQEYKPHFDCIPPGPDLDRSGQRSKTALLFLNDDFEGGETHFPAGELKVRGGRGDILVFSNLTASGAPDPASRHAGLPIRSGEKWLASKWLRTKKFLY